MTRPHALAPSTPDTGMTGVVVAHVAARATRRRRARSRRARPAPQRAAGGWVVVAALGALACGPDSVTPPPDPLPEPELPTVLPDRPFLLVVNKADHTLSAVDPRSGTETATVSTGRHPHEVAVTSDGTLAVVTDYGDATRAGQTLTVVDLATFTVARTVDLGVHTAPHGVVATAGPHVWVTTEGSGHVVQVDPTTGVVSRAVPTGQSVTHMVALSPDLDRLVTANIGSGTATLISAAEGTVLAQLRTGAGAEGVDVHPDGRRAYVSNRAADTLSEIDLEAGRVVRSLQVGDFPIRVKVRPDGREALVSNAQGNEVVAVDLEDWAVVRRLAVGAVPVGILITPDNTTAYVANTGDDRITVIDLAAWTVRGQIAAGRQPDGMDWVR